LDRYACRLEACARALRAAHGLTLVLVVALGAATVCSFLYARDSTTGIGALDRAASSAAAEFERALVALAFSEPARWVQVQDAQQCCGVALSTQLAGGSAVTGGRNMSTVLLTGTTRGCSSRTAQVDALVAKWANNSAEAEAEAEVELGADFFCSDSVREQLLRNSGYYGAASCVTEVMQLASLSCAVVLVCGSAKRKSDYDWFKRVAEGVAAGPDATKEDLVVSGSNAETAFVAPAGDVAGSSAALAQRPVSQDAGLVARLRRSMRESLRDFFLGDPPPSGPTNRRNRVRPPIPYSHISFQYNHALVRVMYLLTRSLLETAQQHVDLQPSCDALVQHALSALEKCGPALDGSQVQQRRRVSLEM
jgi:hypothetical protein